MPPVDAGNIAQHVFKPDARGQRFKVGDKIALVGTVVSTMAHEPPSDIIVNFGDARGIGSNFQVALSSGEVFVVAEGNELLPPQLSKPAPEPKSKPPSDNGKPSAAR